MASSDMTIKDLSLYNFKGYKKRDKDQPVELDLDNADLILVTGKNGVGKTSILQALDCCLNQGLVPSKFLNENEKTGFVSLNGTQYIVQKDLYQDLGLASVSTFFFQESIARLACNSVIELLEPENKPGLIIKNGLKSLQAQIEAWQLQLQRKAYSKDYEGERKKLAIAITEFAQKLPEDFPAKESLLQSTLTLKGGNLQSKWQSQLRNLSATVSKINDLPEVIGESISIHLEQTGKCLKDINFRYQNIIIGQLKSKDIYRSLLERLRQFPEDLEVLWNIESKVDIVGTVAGTSIEQLTSGMVMIGCNQAFYEDQIKSKTELQEDLRAQYKNVKISLESLSEIKSIDKWLESFHTNIGNWLQAFDSEDDKTVLGKVTKSIASEVESLNMLTSGRQDELLLQRERIEEEGKNISSEIQQLVLSKSFTEMLLSYSNDLSPIFGGKLFKIHELIAYCQSKLSDEQETKIDKTQLDYVSQLVNAFFSWSKLEFDYELDQQNSIQTEAIKQANETLKSAHKICKQESSAGSQLLNLMGEIPAVELQNLTATMNSLLDKFHFPKDFLPISLKNIGTEKSPAWTFKTSNGVKFDDLSTGQKTQLAICWTINLNLALTETLKHRVIGFDDFTTSLDMNQLIPAAVLLRKLAYADRYDRAKRQVIVTSHHEDLTNRLLDLLLPPNGYKMRVIQFEDWSPETGPIFRVLKVDLGEYSPSPEKIKLGVKRLFSSTNQVV